MLSTLSRLSRLAVTPRIVGFAGGTATPGDAADILRRLRGGESVGDGPHIQTFENALAAYHETSAAITFAAGRMALFALLTAMDLREGDEIILPGFTCVVIPNAIRYAGQKSVYVDISPHDFNMDPDKVQAAITPRTKAILAQSTFGIPCDLDALGDISQRTGIPLIEDGCHSIGARWRDRPLGADTVAGFFSTQLTKMFSTERGGYVVTRDSRLAQRLRDIQEQTPFASETYERLCVRRWCYHARWSGSSGHYPRAQVIAGLAKKFGYTKLTRILEYDAKDYADEMAGKKITPYPGRLGNLMAYAGMLQLDRIESDLAHRRRLAAMLTERLAAMGADVPRIDTDRMNPSWVRFPFVVDDRKAWAASMTRCGLTPGYWLNDPIHPIGSNWEINGYQRGSCPVAERIASRILNVPVHSRVAVEHITQWLNRCERNRLASG